MGDYKITFLPAGRAGQAREKTVGDAKAGTIVNNPVYCPQSCSVPNFSA